jgi:RNA-directed DNA polymerase
LSLIRYADDFVILHEDENVVQECKVIISKWLKDIGLELKPSKTKISHTLYEHEGNKGFDFLGFTIRQFPVGKTHSGKLSNGKLSGFKTIIKPSDSKVKKHLQKVGDVIKEHKSAPQKALIAHLNPIIRGWVNYYSTQCSKETFNHCDHIVYSQLKRWGERRHPNKPKAWVADKHADKAITRHIKVKGNKSPYDGDMVYWATRLGTHPEAPTKVATLLKKQKGKCNHCGLYFTDKDKIEIDHIIPRSLGAKINTTTYNCCMVIVMTLKPKMMEALPKGG